MHSLGEEVRLITNIQFAPEEDTMMSVDSCEDEWYRLNDIRLNGPVCFSLDKYLMVILISLLIFKYRFLNTLVKGKA